ncbi:MAG TPA: cupin domain-containing protein [Atribacteraceae bacterium]|nr:cupin domain-containing protein [Atribacteraceae bacterium]
MSVIKKRNVAAVAPDAGSNTWQDVLGKIGENVVRDTIMLLKDGESESGLINVGYTTIYPHCSTKGHEHPPKEEIYYILSGKGIMDIAGERFDIEAGDVVYIPFEKFHRTENPNGLPLVYVWVTVKKDG